MALRTGSDMALHNTPRVSDQRARPSAGPVMPLFRGEIALEFATLFHRRHFLDSRDFERPVLLLQLTIGPDQLQIAGIAIFSFGAVRELGIQISNNERRQKRPLLILTCRFDFRDRIILWRKLDRYIRTI